MPPMRPTRAFRAIETLTAPSGPPMPPTARKLPRFDTGGVVPPSVVLEKGTPMKKLYDSGGRYWIWDGSRWHDVGPVGRNQSDLEAITAARSKADAILTGGTATPVAGAAASAKPASTGNRWADLTLQVAAQEFKDNPALQSVFYRLIQQESNFSDDVVSGRRRSSAGAIGIGQFMPDTARAYGIDPLNPEQALHGAARYLKDGLSRYGGDVTKAVASYNAGAGGVDKAVAKGGANWQAYLPDETKLYLSIIKPSGTATTGSTASGAGDTDLSALETATTDMNRIAGEVAALQTRIAQASRERGKDENGNPTASEFERLNAQLTAKQQEFSESAARVSAVRRALGITTSNSNRSGGSALDPSDAMNAETSAESGRYTAAVNIANQTRLMLAQAFGDQLDISKFYESMLSGVYNQAVSRANAALAAGKADVDAAAAYVAGTTAQQSAEIARSVRQLAMSDFVNKGRWAMAERLMPAGTHYVFGWEPDGALNKQLEAMNLGKMVVKTSPVDAASLDPVNQLRESDLLLTQTGTPRANLGVQTIADAHQRMLNNPNLDPGAPTLTFDNFRAAGGTIPTVPDYETKLAALLRGELPGAATSTAPTFGSLPAWWPKSNTDPASSATDTATVRGAVPGVDPQAARGVMNGIASAVRGVVNVAALAGAAGTGNGGAAAPVTSGGSVPGATTGFGGAVGTGERVRAYDSKAKTWLDVDPADATKDPETGAWHYTPRARASVGAPPSSDAGFELDEQGRLRPRRAV